MTSARFRLLPVEATEAMQDRMYRKKPVVIEAVRWDGRMPTVEPLLIGSSTNEVSQDLADPALLIPTLEGEMRAEVGDWIIKGIKGELYPCKADIFTATYEPVSAAPVLAEATEEMVDAALKEWAVGTEGTSWSGTERMAAALNAALAIAAGQLGEKESGK